MALFGENAGEIVKMAERSVMYVPYDAPAVPVYCFYKSDEFDLRQRRAGNWLDED